LEKFAYVQGAEVDYVSKYMKWSAVIFDMDGLMIDSEPIALEVWRALAAEHGREVSEQLYREVIGKTPLFGVQHLRSALELPMTDEELMKEYWSRRTQLMCEKIKPAEGLVELLELLQEQGVLKAVASNSPCEYILSVLKALGLQECFAFVHSSEDVKEGKPAPDIYLSALESLQVEAESCVVLEDSPAGVAAAKAAGLTCYAVPNNDLPGADYSLADRFFDSLIDVCNQFQESYDK
jgi:HAD superfamily hydrolase (TIGR01509 family)